MAPPVHCGLILRGCYSRLDLSTFLLRKWAQQGLNLRLLPCERPSGDSNEEKSPPTANAGLGRPSGGAPPKGSRGRSRGLGVDFPPTLPSVARPPRTVPRPHCGPSLPVGRKGDRRVERY